ncbi:MAG: hypothetical protein H7066_21390 [Cytophagaceae bacterium]|nr:hypothetical protein [Gemmatimonadaceae bacterium]
MRRIVSSSIALVLVVAATSATAQDRVANISFERFKQLRWVVGSWKGSGGNYPAFYESYDMVDDSTMRRYSWSDSTFSSKQDSARFEWRAGRLAQVRNGRAFPALKFTGDTLQWQPPSATWIRTSSDAWIAILADGGTTYTLVRYKPVAPARHEPGARGPG